MLDKEEIDKKTYKCLVNNEPRTPSFYLLPKIHKAGAPGRPILSANGSPTEKISGLVDAVLREFVPSIKSYIKDTTHFIQLVENTPVNKDTILFTLDVKSLYTNIPHQEGISHIARILAGKQNLPLAASRILQLLKLVLTKNNFEFNEKHFLQIKGVAMGSIMAPTFAILYLSVLEEKLLSGYQWTPDMFKRFIDDIFGIWRHGEQKLLEFVEYLNNSHPTIKFTIEYSKAQVNFLDTIVYIEDNMLKVKLYTKPTDTHSYLCYDSSHPNHCKTKGPYGQFLRIKRNNTDPENYERDAIMLTAHYKRRGYPDAVIAQNKEKADSRDRKDLINPSTSKYTSTDKGTPFVTMFHPHGNLAIKTIHKYWDVLDFSKNKNCFLKKPILALKRQPNLRDMLVKAKISYPPVHPGISGRTGKNEYVSCTKQSCKYCAAMTKTDSVMNSKKTRKYTLKRNAQFATCKTTNVVYIITCDKCRKQYIGETKRMLYERLREHLRDTTVKRDTPVSKHFNRPLHTTSHIKVQVLEVIKRDPDEDKVTVLRRQRERYWIYQLGTMSPSGINLKE
jgi:hypothetical protein